MKKVLPIFWIALVLAILYLPILILVVYSFTDAAHVGSGLGEFSFQNYINLFSDESLREMIVNTILLALIIAIISTILGTLGALGSFYSKKHAKLFISLSNQIPIVNTDVVTGFSICVLLIILLAIPKDTFLPLGIGMVSLCAPFVYITIMPRLKQLDNNLYEAALDLGATPTQALTKVIIPQLMPSILSGFMLSVTLTLDDYFITTYTKPSTFDTISTYVVNATRGGQTEIKTALWALSTVIFLIVLVVVILMNVIPQLKKEDQ